MSARTDAADWALYSNLNLIKSGNFTIAAGRILEAADRETFSPERVHSAARALSDKYGFSQKLARSIAGQIVEDLRRAK